MTNYREYDHIEIKAWSKNGEFKEISLKEGERTHTRAARWLESIGR